ncbi:DUF1631 domain-containing protein [Dokdonella sp. MW10]|uniref:DUF1631 domain-containing protein n=1 Tax=Dokdonella sp. MW10 TaxID=2992926 RepID=UPI003F800550
MRALLEGLLARTAFFDTALSLLFDEIEQHLFKQADRAHTNEQQARMFESIRAIKRGKADIMPRFLVHLETRLAQLDEIASLRDSTPTTRASSPTKLELVDSSDLEVSLAMQDIASKSEIRHTQALHMLGHRLGVMAGRPAFDAEDMPLAPFALVEAMRYAIEAVDIGVNDRILVFQAFDRVVMGQVGTFYEACNQYLSDQRVLANLQPRVQRHVPQKAADPQAKAEQKASEAKASPSPDDDAATPQAAAQAGTGTANPRADSPRDATASPAAHDPAPSPPPPGSADLAAQRDAVLFSTLRQLLAERRRSLGVTNTAPAASYLATRDDLRSVLDTLQKRPAGSIGDPRGRAPGHLKHDLLNQLRAHSPQGRAPVLAEEDSDTIDLVGMLFDYIAQSLGTQGAAAQSLMSRLQVPVLRTALGDKTFFTNREHPARVLLNSVAEAGTLWMGDDDGDRGFADKMTSLVDRVTNEFDGDVSLIENLVGDLGRHVAQLTRRAEMAERRHIDAAKGREKLDLARERANGAITRLLSRSGKVPPMVRAVLEQAWTDVLALTLLRQGEESQAYRRRLAVADQLLKLGEGDAASRVDAALRDEVRNGLVQVGLHAEEVDGVVGKLFDPGGTAGEKKTSHTELAFTLKSKPRLGVDGATHEPAEPAEKVAPAPLTAEEQRMLQRIRSLPFGTWFEFVTNQQGATVRRKLAWFSTVTGRCLFVNQRGARAEERSMDQLARDLVRGQVKLYNAEGESMIDRAWKAIMGTLQQFAGHPGNAMPA